MTYVEFNPHKKQPSNPLPSSAPHLKATWVDSGREPRCPPNPEFPAGVELIDRRNGPSCAINVPYPAKRCGRYEIKCSQCGTLIGVTTAGRIDDVKTVRVRCKITAAVQ